ncbi:Mycocerosic acid synthase [Mycobacterium simulans]|uniref:Mycocerosic acid synthase n=1 Tax=Mycobacterium simulans TaxID=627089 RepID=A0A7Z7II61_9MYCO|nr:type I polyketide synthase [Mycobacterium simulans]SOJ53931.1 Mycocerosic acid synthase [Mycobacterium simulans]
MSRIAIVGIGCRYAGGIDSAESFWDFVVRKGDGVVDIPAERWDYRRYYDPDKRAAERMYTKRAAFLECDPWQFDSDFFGISPREGTTLDPQQRLIMEVAWEALDDAGVAGQVSGQPVGVYVGAFTTDHVINAVSGSALAHVNMHSAASASFTMLSNRLAYALNLKGPALTVDTACSSSLVAFHLACQGISNGDCDMALVGGVNMMLQPETFVTMCKGGFLATDGRCKSFSASADGYGRGEGAGMVLLRKLDDAVRDGDRIYAVVEATGSNQDGRTTAITVPSLDSQEALARSVCERSGIAPHRVTYVEAHGTGTPVGDPVELRALGRVYGAVEGRNERLPVGSVKSTLGHTEAAAGVASVIKGALAVYHRTLPPQGWFEDPNPDIPFEDLRIAVQLEAEKVGADIERMTVAINGFGYGGTNAHAILTEPQSSSASQTPLPLASSRPDINVFPLSARSEAAARALAGTYAELLESTTDLDHFLEAAWTRRAHHRHRAGLAFSDAEDLAEGLRKISSGAAPVGSVVGRSAGSVFVFSGMGPQWWAMGRDLLNAGGAFASEAARIDDVFTGIAGWSIIEELLRPEDESQIASTAIAQPANFLVQVALTHELATFGITPSVVVGHSVGEVSAAYVAGMLSLEDALRVSHHRGRLQATTAGTGGMLAIGLPVDEVRPLLHEYTEVDVAAINSPSSVTVAGDPRDLESLSESLSDRGIFTRMLRVEVPYHSRRMDPILDELRAVLADVAPQQPSVPLYSSVTGEAATNWDADYWCDNVRQPVRFADAVKTLIRAGHRIFVEVGPHPVLSANIREILLAEGESGTTVSTLDRNRADAESIRQTIAGLYVAGHLDPADLFTKPAAHYHLPHYPWQRQLLHQELPEHVQAKYGTPDGYSMLGDPDLYDRLAWELRVSGQSLPWLADHVVNGACLIPGAAYLDAALSAAAARTGANTVTAEDVRFVAPLIVDPADGTILRTEFDEPSRRFTIRSRAAANTAWTVHATGRLVDGTYLVTKHSVPDTRDMTEIAPAALYAVLGTRGLTTGPNFQRIRSLHASAIESVATVDARPESDVTRHMAHPCVIDAALQTVAPLIDQAVGRTYGTVVPIAVDAIRAFAPFTDDVTVIARRHVTDPMCADIVILDTELRACMQIVGVRFGSITPGRGALDHMDPLFYEEVWDLRDPLSLDALVPAEQTATLVVAVGDGPHARAQELCDNLPHATYHEWTGGVVLEADAEVQLMQQLWDVSRDRPRVHVCVVAGHITDDTGALWALQRIAITTERFLDEQAGAGSEEKSVFGDGSVGDDSFYVSLVTERAFAHHTDVSVPNPSHAGLAGARRVMVGEQPRLRWRLIDVDPDTNMADLVSELLVPGAFSNDMADEVLLRSGLRFTPVIMRTLPQRLGEMAKIEPLHDPEANFTVEVPKSRIMSELGWRRCPRRSPGRGQVELHMQVVGLNYKDAIKVLGLLGERELAPTHFGTELGMEGVGVVTRVGPDVSEPQVGDVVITAAKGMLTRYHLAEAALCGKLLPASGHGGIRPEHCTSITAFLTAERSLLTLARLQPGETVLIHGAAGGVGSAAIQVAKARGAAVIGTARTDERRAYALAAGADHVIDSRSLNFVEDVYEITNGRGADVIISSAPGEILRHNFDAVAEFGRIVEVGKADIYQGGTLDLAAFDKNVGYFSIDMDRMLAHDSAGFVELITSICEKFSNGTYQPLSVEVFGTADLARACEEVFRSDRTGRVAVRLNDVAPPVRPSWQEVVTDPEAAYMITGGYGGFGLATGRWLVRRGARHLILVGRSGATTEIAKKRLAQWRTLGIEVTEELLDVTDADAVNALVRRSHRAERPLRGIFHTAGAVADQRVADLELESLKRVYDAKVQGARALWAAVADAGITLDQFAFYSSGGSMLGTMGQFSYTAANLALQCLTEEIVRQGQSAICIGWGHMSGLAGGMASDETAARYLNAAGFDPIDMDDGPIYLEAAMRLGITQAAIIPINWSKVNATVGHLRNLLRTAALVSAAADANSTGERLRANLAALDEGKRGEVVAYMLAEQLAAVMGVSAESIEIDIPVTELGLDSLMAVEFGARASQALGVHLATLQMGRTFDLRQAGSHIAEVITTGTGVVAA